MTPALPSIGRARPEALDRHEQGPRPGYDLDGFDAPERDRGGWLLLAVIVLAAVAPVLWQLWRHA